MMIQSASNVHDLGFINIELNYFWAEPMIETFLEFLSSSKFQGQST